MAMPIIEQAYRIPVTGGNTTALNNIGGAGAQVIGADQARKSITFANPNIGGNVNLMVFQMTDASGNALNPSFAAPGGGWPLLPGAMLTFAGDCQGAWGAVAQTGSANGLTVISSRS